MKKIEEMTLSELKVLAYDTSEELRAGEVIMRAVHAEIKKRKSDESFKKNTSSLKKESGKAK